MFNRRRKIHLLRDRIRKQFKEKVIELVDVGVPNLCGHFDDADFMTCDLVCGKKRDRKSNGGTWWLNEGVS